MIRKYPKLYFILLMLIFVPSIFAIEVLINFGISSIGIMPEQTQFMDILFMSVNTLVAFALVVLYRKFIEGSPIDTLGFSLKKRSNDILMGIVFGSFLMLLGFVIAAILGVVEVVSSSFNPMSLLASFGLLTFVAIHEELILRGFMLNGMMLVSNKYAALIASSIYFAALHLLNPSMNLLSFANIFLAGVLLGISFVHSRNLWFPIGLHFAWNFMQGPILGFEVSGQKIEGILKLKTSGSSLLSGGEFGLEGSLVASVLLLISIFVVNWFFKKSEKFNQVIKVDYVDKDFYVNN